MNLKPIEFQDLVNLDELRSLFEQFSLATEFSVGLVDVETQQMLLRVGWRDICLNFHRSCPASDESCLASGRALQAELGRDEKTRIADCNHGLVDGCMPIIFQGQHVANLLTGQVLFSPPDIKRFKQQAQKYGFDEQAYLESLSCVPIVSKAKFSAMLLFLAETIQFSISAGLTNIEHHKTVMEKEQQLSSILSVVPAGIGLVANRKIEWVNKRMSEMTGYSSEELIGQNVRLLYPSDKEYEYVGREKHAQIREHGTGSVETKLQAKSGSIINIELSSTPLDPDNLSAGIIFNALDITDRKRTLRNLENSEQKYRELFNNMSSGVAIYSSVDNGLDFAIDSLNSSALKSKQINLQEILGRKITQIFPESKSLGLLAVMQRVWKTGKSETLPVQQPTDGKQHLFLDNYVCKLPSGQIVTIFDDVSERIKFENEIIKGKQEWENTFDAMADIVTIQDSDFNIVRANKAAYQFFSADFGELNGKKCFHIFRGIDLPCSGCPLLNTLADTNSHSEIMVHDTLDKTFQVSSSPLLLHDEKKKFLIHVARDITEQERLRGETDRSHRLASLGELAAGVAHEINNPNGSILYNSEMIQTVFQDFIPYLEKSLPENDQQRFSGLTSTEIMQDIPELLNDTRDAALRIKRIVSDLRDFSRYDGSGGTQAVDLNQVVEVASRLAGNTIKKSTDYFSLALAPELPLIQGVSARLEQVVVNLLLNACQALQNPTQKISVSTINKPDSAQVWLQVTDEGRGIQADKLKYIMEPFFTTKRDQGGTGLGLSVSARIVKEHRGDLGYTSTQGLGTTATLKLPPIGDPLNGSRKPLS